MESLRTPLGIVAGNETQLTKCITSNPEIQNNLNENDKFNLKVAAAKLKLEAAKANAQSPQSMPLITCKEIQTSKPEAACDEAGHVTLYKNTPANTTNSDFTDKVSHELLHKAGVIDEELTNNLVNVCIHNEKFATSNLTTNKSGVHTTSSLLNSTTTAAQATAGAAKPSIPQSIIDRVPQSVDPQAINLPSAQQLAATSTQHSVNTDEGQKIVYQESEKQSSGLLNWANALSAQFANPAVAADTHLAVSTTATTNVMPVVSTSTASVSTYNAASSATSASVPAQNRQVASDSKATANPAASALTPLSNESVPALGKAQATGALPSSAASSGSSGLSGASSSSSSASSTTTNSKATNSTNSASSSSSSSKKLTRDEIVSFVINTDYRTVKAKLNDPQIMQSLVSEKVTILDTNGGSIGAKNGVLKILDKGDSFVRP